MAIQRAVLKGTIADTVEIRNMFTCEVLSDGGDTHEVLWAAYMSSLMDAIPPLATTIVHFYGYEIQEWSNPHWIPMDEISLDEDGEQSGDTLPNQSALVLIAKTAGIRGVGRKFFSGLAESQQNAGVMVVGVATALASLLAAYITPFEGIGGGTITPGVLDKTNSFRPFVGGFVSSLIGSMRRRKPGVGM